MPLTKKTSIHKNQYTKKMKPICSPAKQHKNQDITCYSNKSLEKIKTLWNERHTDDEITSNKPSEIWKELNERFKYVCDTEKCWMRQKFVEGKLDQETEKYTFAPNPPASWRNKPNEWLSNIDIIKVMRHFENYYTQFAFIGPSSIDFDTRLINGQCVWEELCRFSLTKMLKKRKHKIGIIFNTHPHTKNGEHWVSMFIDTTYNPEPYIFYFDSAGSPIKKEIMAFSKRVMNEGESIGLPLQFVQNHPKEHQKGDSECGMYCLHMIIEILTGKKSYKYFLEQRIPDKEMENFRHVYFDSTYS